MNDLLTEIWESIRRNKLRTALTGFAVAWGIFMLIVLLGAGNGLMNAFMNQGGHFATNTMAVFGGVTSKPANGYQTGRRIKLNDQDVAITQSALFSENVIDMSLRGTVTCCSFITFISIVICILLHIMWARTVKSRHTDEAFMIFSVVGYVSLLIEYIIFCFRTPALGAMNFRFVPMCMFYPIIGMALGDDRSGRQHSTDRLCMKAVTYLIIVFSGISAILLWFYA